MHLAALLAVGSALCIAVGDVLQQRAAHGQAFAKLLRDPRWWLGLALLATSIGLQVLALGFGSVLLVQALLMLSLLFALPINARLSDRVVAAREWTWAGVLTAAVVVIVTVGQPAAGDARASLRSWAVVAVLAGPLLAACVVVAAIRGGAPAAVLFALASGSLWGIFAVVSKDVMYRLSHIGWAVAATPEPYLGLLIALGGVLCGQLAFRVGSLTASMPTLQVAQPVVAGMLGVVVLGETLQTGRAGLIALTLAALVLAPAIVALARMEAVGAGQARSAAAAAQRRRPTRAVAASPGAKR